MDYFWVKQDLTPLITVLVLGSVIYYWLIYSYWSRRNVKGPAPLPIVGNLLPYFFKPRQVLEDEWGRKYGKIYGTYQGYRPFLNCADARVLRRICVKDFDKFTNHHMLDVPNKYQKEMVIMLKDDHWRGMRAIMSPAFSGSKMKVIFNISQECSDALVEQCKLNLDKDTGKGVIDLRKLIGAHMMRCAMSSFYGLEPKKNSYHTLEEFSAKNRIASEQTYFRFIHQVSFFVNLANKIIEARKKAPSNYKDFLQLLLDANLSEDSKEKTENDRIEAHHAPDMESTNDDKEIRPSKVRLTDSEVSTQAMMFLMVSSETSLGLISSTIYLLAHHQDIQERLYQEVKQFKEKPLNYEDLSSCLYLDCVISESLRLMSPAISLDRVAKEDYYIEEYNIVIPKGTIINLNFYAIMRDPDYWPEPEKFDPERFKPENKEKIIPGSYCPFGIGPRACIGYRFALTEAKQTLIKLMNEFHFDKAPGTKYPPEQEKASFVINITTNMLVTIKQRQ